VVVSRACREAFFHRPECGFATAEVTGPGASPGYSFQQQGAGNRRCLALTALEPQRNS
jgi:hypothetical protein